LAFYQISARMSIVARAFILAAIFGWRGVQLATKLDQK
jgi:hypothetical protein